MALPKPPPFLWFAKTDRMDYNLRGSSASVKTLGESEFLLKDHSLKETSLFLVLPETKCAVLQSMQ